MHAALLEWVLQGRQRFGRQWLECSGASLEVLNQHILWYPAVTGHWSHALQCLAHGLTHICVTFTVIWTPCLLLRVFGKLWPHGLTIRWDALVLKWRGAGLSVCGGVHRYACLQLACFKLHLSPTIDHCKRSWCYTFQEDRKVLSPQTNECWGNFGPKCKQY